ncbi:hypothetical protein KEM56_000669 [Ascosphaera pollenicola]|nr:hypothetical protein KEM56_000669 [Ascosphaera pollenicola]
MQQQQLPMQQQPAAPPVVQTGAQQRPQQQQAPRPVSQTPLPKYPQSQSYLQHLQTFQQLPPELQNRLNSTTFAVPPTETSKEQQETWLMGAKARFGQFLHNFELASKTINEINRRIEQRRAATNNQIPPQELAELQNKLKQACAQRDEGTEFMNKFRRQQETFRTSSDNIQKTAVSQAQPTLPLVQQPLQQVQQQAQPQQPQQLQPQMQAHQATTGPSQVPPAGPAAHTIDSAVHAARAGQQQPNITGGIPAPQMTPGMGVPSAAVRPTMNQGTPQSQPQQIGQSARASTSSAAGTPTPGQGLGNGRQTGSSDKDKQGNNQPRALDVKPVLPVQMPPARPTLTGGPGNTGFGVMGQPAVQKHPGYVIESEGQRVLSKKMLDVLVRQVTGGGEAEGLTPDAEEFILHMADDFVDDVVTSACRLAKLRTSSTLDIRDIQLILERNYNMRISGFSADDLRTVRKPNPTPSWAAKMSAVQAAKMTQGRTE